jgi:hypothetical protein
MARPTGRRVAGEGTSEAPVGELMTVDEVIARYAGERILMKVTEFDEYGWPQRGYVLAHSPDRRAILRALKREPRRDQLPPDAPRLPYYSFRADPYVDSGSEWEAAMGQFVADFKELKAQYDTRSRG